MDDMKLAKGIVLGVLIALTFGWTYTYDTDWPLGSDAPSVLDDSDRLIKDAVQERMNVDHYWPLTGSEVSDSATGQHRQIEFYGPITTPTNAANKFWLYSKDVDDKAELHGEDEDGNEIQLTSAGEINFSTLTSAGGINFSTPIVSTVATGTAPLTIASTTKVTNLNADTVDGFHAEAYVGGESTTLPGGMIIKCGEATSNTDHLQVFTFDTAFPNNCIIVTISRKESNTTIQLGPSGITKTKFTVNRPTVIDGDAPFFWIAIGY